MGGWGTIRSNMDSSNVSFLLLIGGNWLERIRKKKSWRLKRTDDHKKTFLPQRKKKKEGTTSQKNKCS